MTPSLMSLQSLTAAWVGVSMEAYHAATAPRQLAIAQDLRARWDAAGPEARATLLATHAQVQGVTLNLLDGLVCYTQTKKDRTGWLDLIQWALAQGFDPNRYNGLATPVGLAGYSHQVDVLELFRQHGADLCLELPPEHATPGMTGTTLLYRIALNPGPNMTGVVRTLAYLAQNVPESVKPDAEGRSPLTDPMVKSGLRQVIAVAMGASPA